MNLKKSLNSNGSQDVKENKYLTEFIKKYDRKIQ